MNWRLTLSLVSKGYTSAQLETPYPSPRRDQADDGRPILGRVSSPLRCEFREHFFDRQLHPHRARPHPLSQAFPVAEPPLILLVGINGVRKLAPPARKVFRRELP